MTVREPLRGAAWRLAPGRMANRARRHERGLSWRRDTAELAGRLLEGHAPVVRGGPFSGMRYPSDRLRDIDAVMAKLVGSYERELAGVFARALASGVSTFIDVGCADGYYAVGMAYSSRGIRTLAYDLSSDARELCRATAVASGVEDRVLIAKRAKLESFHSHADATTLVLCDIEGAEVDLLDARAADALARSAVVVEVHEDERPGAAARLQAAFARTHGSRTVRQQPRPRLLSESRGPGVHWLVFNPKAR